MKENYLYIIEFNDLYKIGYSKDPEKRLKQLTLGPSAKIIYKKQYPISQKIEKYLHDKYKDFKFSNEWFGLNEEQIEDIKDFDFFEWIKYGF